MSGSVDVCNAWHPCLQSLTPVKKFPVDQNTLSASLLWNCCRPFDISSHPSIPYVSMRDSRGVEAGVASPRAPVVHSSLGPTVPSPGEGVAWSSAGVPRALTSASATEVMQEEKKWNTKALPARTAVDLLSAACAAGLVAPFITTIDKCVKRVCLFYEELTDFVW